MTPDQIDLTDLDFLWMERKAIYLFAIVYSFVIVTGLPSSLVKVMLNFS